MNISPKVIHSVWSLKLNLKNSIWNLSDFYDVTEWKLCYKNWNAFKKLRLAFSVDEKINRIQNCS